MERPFTIKGVDPNGMSESEREEYFKLSESERYDRVMREAWLKSGDLHVIADRLRQCHLCNEPPPEWVCQALSVLADASPAEAEMQNYARAAVRMVRYVAVREAHDREGLSWEKAYKLAEERLRGYPAAAKDTTMWAEYKAVRKILRERGQEIGRELEDDDPGYSWS
jgi:hypothetical protein